MKTITLIQCEHWRKAESRKIGVCAIGLFGGKPSINTCRSKCEHYKGETQQQPPVDPRILENIRKQHGPCRGCGD